jgi:hypothetical protein
MKHNLSAHFLWHIHGVIGWFLGALAWRTCAVVFAGAPAVGATTQRKKLAYNIWLTAT